MSKKLTLFFLFLSLLNLSESLLNCMCFCKCNFDSNNRVEQLDKVQKDEKEAVEISCIKLNSIDGIKVLTDARIRCLFLILLYSSREHFSEGFLIYLVKSMFELNEGLNFLDLSQKQLNQEQSEVLVDNINHISRYSNEYLKRYLEDLKSGRSVGIDKREKRITAACKNVGFDCKKRIGKVSLSEAFSWFTKNASIYSVTQISRTLYQMVEGL